MTQSESILLSRDVQATLIPQGEPVTLEAHTKVTITHRLGGNFTVLCQYGMFRISGKDADALGEAVEQTAVADKPLGKPTQDQLWEQLKKVFDPEIPVNIVDLGLVYSLEIEEPEAGRYHIAVAMTLTAPGCGMGPSIAADAEEQLLAVLPEGSSAHVELVWDPPWNQEMISEDGRMELGLV